ncbi:unnamed protein product [Brachionus calyciflorus]|uniref:Integrase catalytic domain-containing protein n=1 Tax=Brachionus calyciflorus TaxID=104777 RepID=A0A813TV91_9BILA|nr:unnamed protein product [Brachionus calyciflorus]
MQRLFYREYGNLRLVENVLYRTIKRIDQMKKTIDKIRSRFYRPYLQTAIKKIIRECEVCQKSNVNELITTDIAGQFQETKRGNKYFQIINYHCSKVAKFCQTNNNQAETVADNVFDKWCCTYGILDCILSDPGTQFQSKLLDLVYDHLDIKRQKTTPYHPQCDGQSEVKRDIAPQKDEEDEPEKSNMLEGKKNNKTAKTKNSTSKSSSSESEVEWDESDEETLANIKEKLKKNFFFSNQTSIYCTNKLEEEPQTKSFKTVEQTNDEDSNDSFKSIIFIKDEQKDQMRIFCEFHQQIEELKNKKEQLKQSLNETRKRECKLVIEVALNQVKSELLKNEMDILKKEREEAAELAKKLNELFKKKTKFLLLLFFVNFVKFV